jgi:hypothetical protein
MQEQLRQTFLAEQDEQKLTPRLMVPIIAKEGVEALRGDACCD